MTRQVVTVFGGSGFIGRHVVRRLAAAGATVRIAGRDPESAHFLRPAGNPGQVVPWRADVRDPDQVVRAVAGADGVINLVGILSPRCRQTFEAVHVDGARQVARAAREAGAGALVHLSALGADPAGRSAYARTKAEGEAAVRQEFPDATILRPSVVFGPEDGFFNRFAGLARLSPVLPVVGTPLPPPVGLFKDGHWVSVDLFGAGGPRFQPVWVGDVAEAAVRALWSPIARGQVFELGGPRTYSFKEIMEQVLHYTGRRNWLMPLPLAIARLEAFFLERLPKPPLTRDQVTLLETDNVVSVTAPGLAALGIAATPAETVLPTYLHRYRPPARQGEAGVRTA